MAQKPYTSDNKEVCDVRRERGSGGAFPLSIIDWGLNREGGQLER